jgi:Na+/melibiose symporter-like transporter
MGEFRQQLSESRTAMAEVFRNPELRRLDLAFAGSVIGDWAFAVSTSVYAYSVGGATAVGVYGVARYLTMAVLAPFASMLADRFDRRRVMVCADVIRVILVTLAAIVVHQDGPSGIVYVLAIATGVGGSAFRPAEAALLPKLVAHPGASWVRPSGASCSPSPMWPRCSPSTPPRSCGRPCWSFG